MKEKIFSTLTVLFYVILSISFVVGEFHSFKKHGAGDGFMGVMFFPWGIYRGAESLWHDDYADIDWDKRMETDMRISFYFLSNAGDGDRDQVKYNEDLEKFSARISNYPKDKKEYLKSGSRKCCQFIISSSKDVMKSMVDYYKSKDHVFIWSENTNKLETDLIGFKMGDETSNTKKSCEIAYKDYQDKLDSTTFRFDSIDSKFDYALDIQRAKLSGTFKFIFNEEL